MQERQVLSTGPLGRLHLRRADSRAELIETKTQKHDQSSNTHQMPQPGALVQARKKFCAATDLDHEIGLAYEG